MNDEPKKTLWQKIPNWGKWLAAVVAGAAALGTAINWARAGVDAVHWQHEADQDRVTLEQHHDSDVQMVLQEIADQKRLDRVGRNQRELKRLERDFIAGRYANDDERDFMKDEIKDLKAAIRCDNEGICQ